MGQTHKVPILHPKHCFICSELISEHAWKRRKSIKFYCEACAKQVDAGTTSKRKD